MSKCDELVARLRRTPGWPRLGNAPPPTISSVAGGKVAPAHGPDERKGNEMKRGIIKLIAMTACVYAIAAVINLRQDFVSTPETRALVTGMRIRGRPDPGRPDDAFGGACQGPDPDL